MIIDYFPASVAADISGNVARSAEANVYALSDTSFSAPLAITDLQGVPMAKLSSSALGIYPAFRVVNGTQQIVVVSGDLKTPMTSLSVAAAAAEAAAQLAATSASAADSAASTAATARTDAVAAAAAATAVGNTNDTIIEGRIKDPASKTALALGDKFVPVDSNLSTLTDKRAARTNLDAAPAYSAHKYIPESINPATTDVSAYVQQVIDEAAAAGNDPIVFFPSGTTVAEVRLPTHVHLVGASHGWTVIKAVPGSTRKGVITLSQAGGPVTRMAIENLAIVGDSSNPNQWGIFAKGTPRSVSPFDSGIWYSAIRNVRVTNTLGGGIWLLGGGQNNLGPMQFMDWNNVSVQVTAGTAPNWVGILLSGQVGQISFTDVESSFRGTGYGHRGVWIAREMDDAKNNLSDRWGYTLKFSNCTFQGAAVAIQVDRAQGVSFDTCWIEDNRSGFLVQQAAKGITFISCDFMNTATDGSGTGYVGKVLDTSSVLVMSPSINGATDILWAQDASSIGNLDVLNSTDNVAANRPLSGFPKSLPATGNVTIGANRYVGITGAAQINSITPTLEHGSIVCVRALSDLNIVGTGGNIRFPLGLPSSQVTFPVNSRLVFQFDRAANSMTLIAHTGTVQYSAVIHWRPQANPSAPADGVKTFARTNGSSKAELCAMFPDGTVTVLATQP